ncbi:unnamed protein product [Caenorhabditis angaria]|uniref:Uncharacterized protein n=1 Tax=Caenorhabditis angaria TaxID=860376 RepID=A0A9P1IPH6_9PELO|nr:unnamed protein product [Caenorhabditis angaria]
MQIYQIHAEFGLIEWNSIPKQEEETIIKQESEVQIENNLNNIVQENNFAEEKCCEVISIADQKVEKIKEEEEVREMSSSKPKRRRAKKIDIMSMSESERLNRKRWGARQNTANYNMRKKHERCALENECKNYETELNLLIGKKNKLKTIFCYIHDFIQNYARKSDTTKALNDFEKTEQHFNEEFSRIRDHPDLIALNKNYEKLLKSYHIASENAEQKMKNPNTYGSTKSRAKSEQEMAKMKYELRKTQIEIEHMKRFFRSIEMYKEFFKNIFSSDKVFFEDKHLLITKLRNI